MKGRLAALIGAATIGAIALTGCGGTSESAGDTRDAAQSKADALVDDVVEQALDLADDGPVLTADDRRALNAYQGTVSTISSRAAGVAECANAGDVECVTARLDGLSGYAARQIVRLEPITAAVDLACLRASGERVDAMLHRYVTANVYFSTGDIAGAVDEVNAANGLAGDGAAELEACTAGGA